MQHTSSDLDESMLPKQINALKRCRMLIRLEFFKLHRVSKNWGHFYFFNNSVKHWPILIIFCTRHCEETWHKWL